MVNKNLIQAVHTGELPAQADALSLTLISISYRVAQAVSSFGSKITREALAYSAVLTLAATPAQMSILSVAGAVPVLLVGLFVGVWVDRLPRRPLMIVADLARAVALSAIPRPLSPITCRCGCSMRLLR